MIMTTYSENMWMAPKGRRARQLNRQAQEAATANVSLPCHDRAQLRLKQTPQCPTTASRQQVLAPGGEASPIAKAPTTATVRVARLGSAATAVVFNCQRSPRTSVSQANSRPDEGRDRNLGSEGFLYLLKGLFRTVFECNSRQVAKPIIITDDIFRRRGRY